MLQKEGLKVSGKITIRSHPAGTLHLYQTLVELGKLDQAQELFAEGKIEVEQKNLIVDSSNYGIDILVQYLISAYNGSFAFPLGIAWGEIGTGTTTPANSDTASHDSHESRGRDLRFRQRIQHRCRSSSFSRMPPLRMGRTTSAAHSSVALPQSAPAICLTMRSSRRPTSKSSGVDTTFEIDI